MRAGGSGRAMRESRGVRGVSLAAPVPGRGEDGTHTGTHLAGAGCGGGGRARMCGEEATCREERREKLGTGQRRRRKERERERARQTRRGPGSGAPPSWRPCPSGSGRRSHRPSRLTGAAGPCVAGRLQSVRGLEARSVGGRERRARAWRGGGGGGWSSEGVVALAVASPAPAPARFKRYVSGRAVGLDASSGLCLACSPRRAGAGAGFGRGRRRRSQVFLFRSPAHHSRLSTPPKKTPNSPPPPAPCPPPFHPPPPTPLPTVSHSRTGCTHRTGVRGVWRVRRCPPTPLL